MKAQNFLLFATLVLMSAPFVAAFDSDYRPNEPAGYQPWFEHDWQSFETVRVNMNKPASEVGWFTTAGWSGTTSELRNFELIDDPNAPHGYGKSLRVTFPEGHPSGSGYGSYSHMSVDAIPADDNADHTELKAYYLSFWLYLEPNPADGLWQQFGIQRFFTVNRHIIDECTGSDMGLSFRSGPAYIGPDDPAGYWWIWPNEDCGRSLNTHWKGTPGPTVGTWYHVELLVERLSGGLTVEDPVGDSDIKLWVNDELLFDDVITHKWTTPARQFLLNLNPSAGSTTNLRDRTEHIRLSGIYVSGVLVGSDSGSPPPPPLEDDEPPEETDDETGDEDTDERQGDVNGDGSVGMDDLLIVLDNIGRQNFDARADVNGDGVVNIFDLVIVARNFGTVYEDTVYPYPELMLSQPSDAVAVDVSVSCPSIATLCQVRRMDDHRLVHSDGNSFTVTDSDVTAGVTYPYEARYYVDGQISARAETTTRSITVAAVQTPPPDNGGYVPSEFYPNEPAGYQPWFEHDWSWFETTRANVGANGLAATGTGYFRTWGWSYTAAELVNYNYVSDSSGPHGYPGYIRVKMPQGHEMTQSSFGAFSVASSDASLTAETGHTELEEVYISFWLYMEPHPDDGDYDAPAWHRLTTINRHYNSGHNCDLRAEWNLYQRAHSDGSKWWSIRIPERCPVPSAPQRNIGSAEWTPGEWMHFEYVWKRLTGNMDINDPEGTSSFTFFLNGELIADWETDHRVIDPIRQVFWNSHPTGGDWSITGGKIKGRDDYYRMTGLYVSGVPVNN